MFRSAIAGLACLVMASAAAAQRLPGDEGGDVDAGQAFAVERCGACHATGFMDESAIRQAPPLRDLNRKYDVNGLGESLAEGISVGDTMMPEHILQADEILDLTAYLKSFETAVIGPAN